ncbi:MAG TPA: response regulator [Gemmatimonadales bacterium]|nr:response regulator [Gemmatimonadales bacterium]
MNAQRSSGATPEQSTKTILIVDDDPEFREALVDIVRNEGFAVETATNGMQALDKLRWGLRPCVVLLDMQMAGMTGWDFRAEQSRDPTLAAIPVVAMTAGYWKHRDLGDYAARIAKPIQVPELKATLAKYC